MSLGAARAPRAIDPALERRQREHELHRALEAARALQARLELLADHAFEVRVVHELRDRLAGELAGLATLEPLRCAVCDGADGHHDAYAHAAAECGEDPDGD